MDRRQFLAGVGLGGLTGLAGCTGAFDSSTPTDPPPTQADDVVAGVELPVPRDRLARGAAKDAIPAITDPVFASDWSGLEIEVTSPLTGETTVKEPRLAGDDRVIGVERNGEARAYPLRVLNYHEIVNDTFDGPTLVTFCPLCGSGVTAERRVRGEETTFGVSGLLWNSDLVMYDESTESLWSQIVGTAIRGPETGTELSFVPSQLTTLSTWRSEHPDTTVLLPPPESNTVNGRDATRDYNRNPYAGYEQNDAVGIGNNDEVDERIEPKTTVLGITNGRAATAYPLPAVRERDGVVNDTVGDLPVVVAVGRDGGSLFGFVRRVDGETLTFDPADSGRMRAGGSVWSVSGGEALDGPFDDTTLDPAADRGQMFWFAWADFNPNSEIFGRDDG